MYLTFARIVFKRQSQRFSFEYVLPQFFFNEALYFNELQKRYNSTKGQQLLREVNMMIFSCSCSEKLSIVDHRLVDHEGCRTQYVKIYVN